MGDVAFRSSATNGAGSGTAVTCNKPSGAASGDLLIAFINVNSNYTVTDNNGSYPFTQVAMGQRSYNSASAGYGIWYRVAGASEPASYAFTLSSSDRWGIIVHAYISVDTSTIWDVEPTTSTERSDFTSAFTSQSITTLTDGAMIVAMAVMDSSSATFSATPGDSFNSRENNSGEELLATADKAMPTAGLQNAITWESATSPAEVITQIFALKPAAAGDVEEIDGMALADLDKIWGGENKDDYTAINGLAL